ncbi:restriction endonuclease subunit S [Arthrobacter sp. STN4]|uniref:restriction endonuclease subunit S n=1 Tax=Arthrobacter sp. STN4 TaxID=2923276 RepID=UPI002119E140|nr:restriction endonuclease subunit S [Arthrobacter sp. STN4]MCQ9162972.1 restriction endonuclease subunit S [Arthrobacter sp. STN4]
MREGWRRVRLGDVTKQHIDKFKVEPGSVYKNLGVKWYAEGVFSREPKLGSDMKATSLYRVREGQFIYNRMFATEGSFALVTKRFADGVVSNEFPVFDVDSSCALPEYLRLHFQQPTVWADVAAECVGTTKSRSRWKEQRFAEYEVDLPPLEEQQRIVDLIGSLDEAIEAADGASGAARHSYLALAGALPGPPVRLREVLSQIDAGKSPPGEERTPSGSERAVLKVSAVGVAGFKSDEVKVVAPDTYLPAKSALSSGDIIVVRANGVLSRVGAACRVPKDFTNLFLCDKTLRLVPKDGLLDSDWLLACLKSSGVRNQIEERATGSDMRNLTQKAIMELEIPAPLIETQKQIGSALRSADAVAASATAYAASLRTLRSELLTVLLSGEHEIPESYGVDIAAQLEPAA